MILICILTFFAAVPSWCSTAAPGYDAHGGASVWWSRHRESWLFLGPQTEVYMSGLEGGNGLFSVLLHSCWHHSVISLTAYCTYTLINFSSILFSLLTVCLFYCGGDEGWWLGSIRLPWCHSQEKNRRDGKCIFLGSKMLCWRHVHWELQATEHRKRRLWALVNTT